MYTKDPSQEEALLSPPTIPNPPPPRRPAPTPSAPGPTSRCLRCTGVSPIAAPDQTLPVKAFLSKISMGKEFSLGPASHTGLGGFAKFCRERPTRWTSATCGPRVRTAAAADWDIPVMRGCVLGAAVGTGGRGLPLALWISQPGLQWAARAASWCPDLLCHLPAGDRVSPSIGRRWNSGFRPLRTENSIDVTTGQCQQECGL